MTKIVTFLKQLFCRHDKEFLGEPARPWKPYQNWRCKKCEKNSYSYYG